MEDLIKEPQEEMQTEEVVEESPVVQEPVFMLEDYARLFVVNYKPHHWEAIERFAKVHGWRSLEGSESKCADLLKRYGLKLK